MRKGGKAGPVSRETTREERVRKRRNGRRGKRGTLACGVAFVFKICWRGANERKEDGGQRGGSLRETRRGRERARWVGGESC